jgi:methylated-DNA-[protein]-cysteine S-methyltransferase
MKTVAINAVDTLAIITPVGELTLFAQGDTIIALDWGRGADAPSSTKSPILNLAAQVLKTYFRTGKLDTTTVRLSPHGTAFQQRAWNELLKIKTGHTKTYGDIASRLKSGPRAVGGACAANPIPILIPCHRVLGADGKVGHYSGGDGSKTKQFLLRLEGVDA